MYNSGNTVTLSYMNSENIVAFLCRLECRVHLQDRFAQQSCNAPLTRLSFSVSRHATTLSHIATLASWRTSLRVTVSILRRQRFSSESMQANDDGHGQRSGLTLALPVRPEADAKPCANLKISSLPRLLRPSRRIQGSQGLHRAR